MLRVCSVIERVRVPISDEAFQESDAEKEARIERVNGKLEVLILMAWSISFAN